MNFNRQTLFIMKKHVNVEKIYKSQSVFVSSNKTLLCSFTMHLKYATGHSDLYFFDQNAQVPNASIDTMRFGAFTFRPYVFVSDAGHNDTCFWSRLSGPVYSIVKETTIKYNLRFV